MMGIVMTTAVTKPIYVWTHSKTMQRKNLNMPRLEDNTCKNNANMTQSKHDG